MVHGKNRIPYRIDRRLTGLAGPDYDATISFGLPFELGDSQYGNYRIEPLNTWETNSGGPIGSGEIHLEANRSGNDEVWAIASLV